MYTFFQVAVGLACVSAVALIVYIAFFAHQTPDLQPGEAALQISHDPEFSRKCKVVEIARTTRCTGSMSESCYYADFKYLENGSADPRWGHAYFDRQDLESQPEPKPEWHLSWIKYDLPVSVAQQ